MTELKIKIKPGFTLADVATEVQALNQAVNGTTFPRPIKCNPLSEQPEGFVGDVNTPPDVDGFVTIRLADYGYFDTGLVADLGLTPQTFSFVYGSVGGGII